MNRAILLLALAFTLTTIASPVHRTVGIMGGSITQMENGYRPRLMKLLRERYPDVEFTEIAAGLSSTCSDTAAFRLEEDVLQKGVPDLFLIEEAVNDDQDGQFTYEHCVRGLEGVVRHVRSVNPACTIVIGLMVNKGEFTMLKNGAIPIPYAAGRVVAAHYGAAVYDVGSALVASEKAGKLGWAEYKDCHPSDAGCDFVAEVAFETLCHVYDPRTAPIAKAMPKALDPGCYSSGHAVAFERFESVYGWRKSRPDWERIPGNKAKFFTLGDAIWSETVGASFKVRFFGTALAALLTAGPDAGSLEVSIDGGEFQQLDLRQRFQPLHYPYTHVLADDLENRLHVAQVRLASVEREGKSCHAVRIHRLFVNGSLPDK